MTKFNLNPEYTSKKRSFSIKNIFKPVYLSVILIIIVIIISSIYNNSINNQKLTLEKKHVSISQNPMYKNEVSKLNLNYINSSISNTEKEINLYKFQEVHQNILEVLKIVSDSYYQYLPTGFIIHSFTFESNTDGSSSTSLSIYYLKNYLTEAKTFAMNLKEYIKQINLKDFDNE